MKRITVNTSKKYDVIIDKGILGKSGKLFKELSLSGKVCIVSDSTVAPLYLKTVKKSLLCEGFDVCEYVFLAGEASKNAAVFIDILNFLAKNHFTRKDTVVALGGGVTGDIAGFCAATYMRGIAFIQMPTSLLAAVDSSVGGKTAINLDNGKNLAGAFYQPWAVFFDLNVLETLPGENFKDGCGEIIKYAMISGDGIEEFINSDTLDLEEIISRCVKIKQDIVSKDEFESGLRMILNFGHTAGHCIEKASDYSISHGRAVAMGMYIITNAWEKRGLCRKGTLSSLLKMLEKFSIDFKCTYNATKLCEIAKNDKKADGGQINLVVPLDMGKCDVVRVEMGELYDIFKEGLDEV